MLQPTGPLPAAVYWRRRAVALAGLVVLLVLLIWLVVGLFNGPDGDRADSAGSSVQPAAQQLSDESTATSTTMSSHIPPPPEADVPPPSSAPPATTQPPQPCPDEAIALTAQPEQPAYRVGARPVFKLTVANSSPVPCTRDLDPGLQELLVFAADGTTRLWSSNDCYPGKGNDGRTLQPGEAASFTVTWAGRSSRPNCAGQRVPIPAGGYLVVAKLGPLSSPPTPFTLTR